MCRPLSELFYSLYVIDLRSAFWNSLYFGVKISLSKSFYTPMLQLSRKGYFATRNCHQNADNRKHLQSILRKLKQSLLLGLSYTISSTFLQALSWGIVALSNTIHAKAFSENSKMLYKIQFCTFYEIFTAFHAKGILRAFWLRFKCSQSWRLGWKVLTNGDFPFARPSGRLAAGSSG